MTRRLLAYAALLALAVLGGLGLLTAPAAAAAQTGTVADDGDLGTWGTSFIAAPTVDRMPQVGLVWTLQPDGSVRMKETIEYSFDAGQGTRHGIYRDIVVRQGVDNRPDVYRYYGMSEVRVSSPSGADASVQVIDQGATMRLKIGSANRTVTGTQTYVISYKLDNVANAFPDNQTAELYWNVFKDDAVPKGNVSLEVTAPAPATEVRCGRGVNGDPCATATAGSTSTFTVTNLQSNENLTVAMRYPLAAFLGIAPDIRQGSRTGTTVDPAVARAASIASYAGGALLPILAILGMGYLVSTRGRDEWYAGLTPGLRPGDHELRTGAYQVVRGRTPNVAVQFNPPPGVQPGLVGTIIDESADTIDVSATVIDLAVRGFLSIEEIPGQGLFKRNDWLLTQLVPREGEYLRDYEQTLLEGIFKDANPVLLSSLKNEFADTLATTKKQMYADVVGRNWFRKTPQAQRMMWQFLGFLLCGAGIATAFFGVVIGGSIDRSADISFPIPSSLALAAGLFIAGFIVILLGQRMAAKTADGSAVLAQSLGFKQYLETAEANQIRWEEAQAIFSRYLPYAIVFGCAQRWASVFQQVAAAAEAAGQRIDMPTWYIYSGSVMPDFSSITSGVDSFSSTASGTFASTPGSSGGSGFSGGGGSFSGGGGGGSSSGSW